MGDDGPTGHAAANLTAAAADHHDTTVPHPEPSVMRSRKSTWNKDITDVNVSGTQTPMSVNRLSRIEPGLEDYFVGPRDLDRHSKLPYFMRMHGSVLPRMILPLTMVGAWATVITVISHNVYRLVVNSVLLTVLGFVVGLALSFRSTTAYERYSDGRKAWTTLSVQSRNLARCIWVHCSEREGEEGKDDLLAKITAINMILAFSISLKHKLRFEPYAHYPDLASLVGHLDTFAKSAHREENLVEAKRTPWKRIGEYLGVSFAESNPRKTIKRADAHLGNLPLEILTYLSAFCEEVSNNLTLKSPIVYGQMMGHLAILTDTQSQAERVLTTPLPVGYNILISQIVLLYVYLLPFQLFATLEWVTIPGTIAAAYIILGLHAIGNELENPFGNDVNDLPLDHYCTELSQELNTLTSVPAPKFSDVFRSTGDRGTNKVFWPLSEGGYDQWSERSEKDIRSVLLAKVLAGRGPNKTKTSASMTNSSVMGDSMA